MKRHSDRNLTVIQNFILHLTHSGEHGMDAHYKEEMTFTPEIMYRVAKEYIEEDHVDGKDNPEDIIPTFTAESSHSFEDVEKKFPEHVVIVADYGDEEGTETVGCMSNIDNLANVKQLIEKIKNPY